jgi:methyl-accepting chemotaxis protein-1 (serine sensor receptor)
MMKLTIKARLIATMAFMGCLMILLGSMGIYGMQSSNAALKNTYTDQLMSIGAIGDAQIALLRARTALDRVVLHPESPKAAETITRAEQFLDDANKAWKKYQTLPKDAEESALSDAVDAKHQTFIKDGLQPLINALRAGNRDEAETIMMKKMAALSTDLNTVSDALQGYQSKSAKAGYDASQSLYNTILIVSICATVFGFLAVILSAVFLLKAISHPLQQALDCFDEMAAGDLSIKIEITSSDEMGALLRGLKKMQTSLSETVLRVRESSSSIATATGQISAGNLDLSSRTEQQAASLEETASSMEELTSTVRQNVDNARQANGLAEKASEVAVTGGQVVREVVDTMSSIKESSNKIVDIISVIDGIAFQTNILALNAAVEAARAGEQGRGFAVVATEVRNLAQRSAAAAKEIKALINDSVEKVDAGSKLVDDAGKTMEEIVSSVQRVTDIMSEITAASEEQSSGIEQVNLAITQMDQATQQNAALVEEAAAAAESLKDQAANLEKAVSIFRVNGMQTIAHVSHVSHAASTTPRAPSTAPAVKAVRKPAASSAPSIVSTPKPAVAKAEVKKPPVLTPSNNDDWEEF